MTNITQELLKRLLSYNDETGIFMWNSRPASDFLKPSHEKRWNSSVAGKIAGCRKSDGYIIIRINQKLYRAHRLVWLYIHGKLPENEIDHIDGLRNNNRLVNLIEVTRKKNMQNIRRTDNKTGFMGVDYNKTTKKYQARIILDKKSKHLGSYLTPEEAHNAYLAAKSELEKN